MIRVLFVCHGNICRSPMAEFILKDLVQKAGRAEEFEIASCATSREEIWNDVGNPVYPTAKEELLKHGIACPDRHAVQLQKSDYERYDYLIGMDENNIRNMMRILGSDPEHKVHKLLDYTKRGGDIDLLVCTPCGKQSVLDRILMKTRLKMRLGDQKIDIVGGDENSPVVRTALETGIRLV